MNELECLTLIIAIYAGADMFIKWQREKTERAKYRRGDMDEEI